MSTISVPATEKKRRILVVDDDPEITDSFGLVLEDSGLFKVQKYNDPMIAISKFKPGKYDLVLLDIKMPNIDSFELYERMKKIDGNLKVCYIGTYDDEESHQALMKQFSSLRSECFVPKEVVTRDLITRINSALKS